MIEPTPPEPQPKFSAEIIEERLRTAFAWIEQAADFAHALDWLGDAEKQPDCSEQKALAGVRDEVDFALGQFFFKLTTIQRFRAERTRCMEMLFPAAMAAQGDGPTALHLMRRVHELQSDEDSGFQDSFAWDTYLRVCALAGLAREFGEDLRPSARQMQGWPMIVSHHLDHRAEFQAIAESLQVGADFPLDVGPRKKRGTETPLLHYLEPLIWRLFVLWEKLVEAASESKNPAPEEQRRWRPAPIPADEEGFAKWVYGFWWEFPDPKPKPETLIILRQLVPLPPLTQKTAREWSRKVVVPLIMLEDAGTRETCKEPALRNIWQHRSVKSRATFQSRLHSAVTDTLQRFARPG